jgi:hypothetical protein
VVGALSRRQLLATSAGAGAVAALAGCDSITQATNPTLSKIALKAIPSDLPVLDGLLQLEYMAAFAYTAAAPMLNTADARTARQFLHHELAHITVLNALIESAHGKPSAQRSSYPLGRPKGNRGVLLMLRRVEAESIRAYLRALPRLSVGGVRGVAAAIMANEGQHISVLRTGLGLEAVPAALASGAE